MLATLPSVQNDAELTSYLLEAIRTRVLAAGFQFLSTLVEERMREAGPAWLREASVLLRIDNYLGSGIPFAYSQAALTPVPTPRPEQQTVA